MISAPFPWRAPCWGHAMPTRTTPPAPRGPAVLGPLLLLALCTAHCGSTTSTSPGNTDAGANHDGGPPTLMPPMDHRPTAAACSTTRPPGLDEDAGIPDSGFVGQCTRDADCTMGNNGRCLPSGGNAAGDYCTYDACSSDSDCGSGKVCVCGAAEPPYGRAANTCVPGNCRVDSDCGAKGYCSPTEATSCGNRSGIVGYYCHTAGDDCTNDGDCSGVDDGGPTMGPGYCAWQPASSKWACSYGVCSG